MVCPICKYENNGIKLNGKLYCVSCGEIMEDAAEILEHSYEIHSDELVKEPYIPHRIKTDGSTVEPQNNKTVNTLEAEKEVLEEIEIISTTHNKKTDNFVGKQKIQKNNRNRIQISPSTDFNLIDNEPDPIREPELPPPHDMQVENHKEIDYEKELNYPFHERAQKEEIENTVKEKQSALSNYFAAGAKDASIKIPKKRTYSNKTKFTIGILSSILIIVATISGFVFYVNSYAIKPNVILKKIEEKPNFSYKSPSYIPAGYELSYQSYSYSNEIHYYYKYLPDETQYIIISISETDITSESILNDIIKPQKKDYIKKQIKNLDVWFIGDNRAAYIDNGLIYEISASNELNNYETTKIIEGMI